MRLPQRSTKAFTLIELIVVIVILGILALIAIPTFGRVIAKSQDESTLSSLRAMARNAQALRALDQGSNWGNSPQDAISDTTSNAAGASLQAAGVLTPVADTGSNNPLTGQVTYKTTDSTVVLAMLSGSKRICLVGATPTSVSRGKCVEPGKDTTGAATTSSAAAAFSSDSAVLPGTGTSTIPAPSAPTGVADASFGTNGIVRSTVAGDIYNIVKTAPSGKIVTGGYVQVPNTASKALLTRFNTDGTLDTTFGNNGRLAYESGGTQQWTNDIAFGADGSIFTATFYNDAGTANRFVIHKFTPAGVPDTTFGTGGRFFAGTGTNSVSANDLLVLPDGKVLVVATGALSGSYATKPYSITRLTSAGTLDTTFGNGGTVAREVGNDWVVSGGSGALDWEMELQGSKAVVSFASFPLSTGSGTTSLTRFDLGSGALDTTFGSGGYVTAASTGNTNMAVDINGAIYLSKGSQVTSWTKDGVKDKTFSVPALVGVGVVIDSTGKPLLYARNGLSQYLTRFNFDGTYDSAFGTNGTSTVATYSGVSSVGLLSAALGSDGRIFLAGYTQANGVNTAHLVAVR